MIDKIKKYFKRYPESHRWDMNMSLNELIKKSPKCIKLYDIDSDDFYVAKMSIVLKYPESSHYSIELRLDSTGFYYRSDTFINDERCLDLFDTKDTLDEMIMLRDDYIKSVLE